MDCKNTQHKAQVLCSIYGLLTIGQSIIFVKERKTADLLAKIMGDEGHAVEALHGNFEPAERDRVIDSFREGTLFFYSRFTLLIYFTLLLYSTLNSLSYFNSSLYSQFTLLFNSTPLPHSNHIQTTFTNFKENQRS